MERKCKLRGRTWWMILPFLSRFALFLYILSRRTCDATLARRFSTLAVGDGRLEQAGRGEGGSP